MKKAFTLVELLIVIALIAILSVAVLATINPIEQTNKARDASVKNDAAEVLSAYERYFASQYYYPWNSTSLGVGTTVDQGVPIAVEGTSPLFGVLGASGVGSTDGELIKTSELKAPFASKTYFKAAVPAIDRMYTYHNGSDANYVCFIPKANANRTGTMANKLKCLDVGTGGSAPTLLSVQIGGTGVGSCQAMVDWSAGNLDPSATSANLLCVPED